MGGLIDIRWYSDGLVDADKECAACEMRAPEAWSLLMVHLSRALIDTDFPVPFAVGSDKSLFVFPEDGGTEAVAYHYRGFPLVLEVLSVGQIRYGFERGPFVSEAQRRKAMSLKWPIGMH